MAVEDLIIKGFDGKYAFLSNFFLSRVVYENLEFPSVENAYQAAKVTSLESRYMFAGIDAGKAKRLGRKVLLREDWETVKNSIMEEIVLDKFVRNLELKELLLKTGEAYLEETNDWGDVYWGVFQGKGENHLGKILMKIRSEFKK